MIEPSHELYFDHGVWRMYHGCDSGYLGYLPIIFWSMDPQTAREQITERYAHGGGFRPIPKFTYNKEKGTIKYPGDPALHIIAEISLKHSKETVRLFEGAMVMIEAENGKFEIVRMD